MSELRVLIANEPRSYREVIAVVLRELRPHAQVIVADPETLDEDIDRVRPHLVVCSRLTNRVRASSLAWMVLYPGGSAGAIVGRAGQTVTLADMDFDGFLAVFDETHRQALAGRTPRSERGPTVPN